MRIREEKFTLPDGRTLTLRSAAADDWERLAEHRRITAGETYFMARWPEECGFNEDRMRTYLTAAENSPLGFMVTAFDGGQIVGDLGVCEVRPHLKYVHRAYMGISIRQAYCGCGLGSRMLEIALEQAKQNGLEQLELGVFSDNERAIGLYTKYGFQKFGIVPRAYKLKDGSYRDEITMVRFL